VKGESWWFLFEVMEMHVISPAATIRPEFRTLNLNLNPRIRMEPYTIKPYINP
jgi:hypothetical protein